jgi:hypothetical protein
MADPTALLARRSQLGECQNSFIRATSAPGQFPIAAYRHREEHAPVKHAVEAKQKMAKMAWETLNNSDAALAAKRRDRPYRGGSSNDWIKVKNRKHPAMERG